VYVFRADGTAQPGFPVTLTAPRLWLDPADAQPGRIVTAAAVGDVNGDGIPDIALGSNEQGSDDGNGAFHVIHGDGNNHAGGPEHANWPITYPSYPFLPLVGEGTSQPVSLADINGDSRPDLAVAGLASVTTIADGIQPVIGPGEDIRPLVILDANFRGALSNIIDAIDRPFFQTFAASSFADMDQDGYVDFMSGGAGLGLAAAFAGGGANTPFNHQVGVWNTHLAEGQSFGRMLPGFPQRIEDYLFFVNPSAADVTGDGYPEIVLGSGGYYVHAWDACGREAPGFPEFNGGWVTSSVALGDIDGDNLLEAVVSTRDGYLWAWNTDGPVDGVHPWPEYRHDSRNTGNYEEPLAFGVKTGTAGAIECPLPPAPDAGVDAGPDAGPPGQAGGGGCDCNAVPATSALWPALVVALVWWRRRRS
jgi:MYXO-CTERM domain-containing protein